MRNELFLNAKSTSYEFITIKTKQNKWLKRLSIEIKWKLAWIDG